MVKKPTRISEVRIGLADPNPYSRGTIAAQMQAYSVRSVNEFADAEQLFEQTARRPVHVLIAAMDLMPFSGLQVLESVRTGRPPRREPGSKPMDVHTPVILVTSETEKGMIEVAVRKGVNAILTRPIQTDRLDKAMERVFAELTRGFVTGLQMEKVRRPEYTRFVFFGQFVRSSQDVIRTVFDELQKETNKKCVLDLTNVNFIDELGFGTLLMLHGVAQGQGKHLAVIAPLDTIGRELRSIGVAEVMALFDSHFDYVEQQHFKDRSGILAQPFAAAIAAASG